MFLGWQSRGPWTCTNCGQSISWAPGGGEPYWYHPATSTIWCSGWGDPADDGRQAEPDQ
jgi:hypothetical protein